MMRRIRSSHRQPHPQLSFGKRWFLRYAIALEAQQVSLYDRLAKKAELNSDLEVGYNHAMDMENRHLVQLQLEARRARINPEPWTTLGRIIGFISSVTLASFDPGVALRTIVLIESKAARDYAKARRRLDDKRLADLYAVNQGDEEYHASWAQSMMTSG